MASCHDNSLYQIMSVAHWWEWLSGMAGICLMRLNDGHRVIVNTVNDNLLVHQCDAINLWSSQCIHHLQHCNTSYDEQVVAMNHSSVSLMMWWC